MSLRQCVDADGGQRGRGRRLFGLGRGVVSDSDPWVSETRSCSEVPHLQTVPTVLRAIHFSGPFLVPPFTGITSQKNRHFTRVLVRRSRPDPVFAVVSVPWDSRDSVRCHSNKQLRPHCGSRPTSHTDPRHRFSVTGTSTPERRGPDLSFETVSNSPNTCTQTKTSL